MSAWTDDHSSREESVSRLHTFPTPYPGESFYSVLCRYHVRSGNSNSWYTRMQLFGYNASVRSTLLSAYHLEKVRAWVPESSHITPETMLANNTAFPLYSLAEESSWDYRDIELILSGKRQPGKRVCCMQRKMIHSSGFLRYCPVCACKQKEVYGESYWQILPQLKGAEYCPFHAIPFRNSPVSLADLQWDFHPASSVLDTTSAACLSDRAPHSSAKRVYLTQLAENIDWILKSGIHRGISRYLAKMYQEKLGSPEHVYYPRIPQKNVTRAISCYPPEIQSLIEKSVFQHSMSSKNGSYIYDLDAYAHVMLIMALCGSTENLYKNEPAAPP